MTNEIKDWGCPDWKDASAYPSCADELNGWEWRWQFVRRSPQFRMYWSDLAVDIRENQFPNYSGPKLRTPRIEDTPRLRIQFSLFFMPDPCAAELSENPFTYQAHAQPSIGVPLEEVLNFSVEQKDDLLRTLARLGHWVTANEQGELEKDDIYHYSFDISRPIDSQLAEVKTQLKNSQSKKYPNLEQFKNRRDNWPRHLRVIDAKDQGASHADIFLHFVDECRITETDDSQPNALVSQWVNQAKEVMEKAARLL